MTVHTLGMNNDTKMACMNFMNLLIFLLLSASALGDTMDRISQHTSSDPAHSLSRDDLDHDYMESVQEPDLDQQQRQTVDKRPERDATPSKTMVRQCNS